MKLNFASLFTLVSALAVSVLMMPALSLAAGHIQPVGVTTEQASQLIVWYDQDEDAETFTGHTVFQVTNASTDTGVNIHVQIFSDDAFDNTNLCREHDFNDTLTPTDTVRYVIGNLDEADSVDATTDPGGNNSGAPIPIDVDGTRGFIVVTSVNQVTLPRQAIAHNHLFGSLWIFSINDSPDVEGAIALNAMGRRAVNFATGALAADGTVLDGVTNGYRVLQPSFLSFGFETVGHGEDESHVVSIAFSDTYSDPNGEYRAVPATAVWDPIMFNQLEQGTSCQNHVNTCFVTTGLNNEWETDIDDSGGYADVRLCPAIDIDGPGDTGWVDIAVSGLSGLDNNVGVFASYEGGDSNYATWMFGK